MSVNKVILLGFCGKDPEVRHIGDSKVASFSLATSESYKNKDGERVENVEWHSIVAWRGLAEIAEKYVHKGSKIYLEGKLQTRKWTDANNIERYSTDVVAQSIQLLDRKPSETSEQSRQAVSNYANTGSVQQPPFDQSEQNDDLPY